MAVACSIVRNPDNQSEILFVEAPNGARSVLFDNLREKVGDQDRALGLWLTSKTKKFKEEVSNKELASHRIRLMSRVADLGPKTDTIELNGQTVRVDNMDFTNFQSDPKATDPVGRSTKTLRAYGFPQGGDQGIELGRIRYRISGNEMIIDSSTLNNVPTDISGQGLGSAMYGQLFKEALKEGMTVVSSDNLSPQSTNLWDKMVRLGIAKKEGAIYKLDMFPETYDQNGEPSMAAVIDFTDRQGAQDPITIEDRLDLMDAMIGLPVNDSAELLRALKRGFMPEGYFRPTRQALAMTGLYTSENITEIMTNEALQQEIRDFIYKLEKIDTVVLNDMYINDAYNAVEDGTKTKIGTYKLRNPFIVEQEVANALGGFQLREQFEEALYTDDIQEVVGEHYAAFKNTANDLFHTLKNHKTVSEVLLDRDGMAPRTSGAFETMYEVLLDPQNRTLEQEADLLQSMDNSFWRENPEAVNQLLKSIEGELRKLGMDIEQLPQNAMLRGIDETKDFLVAVRDFAIESNRDTFNKLVEEYHNLYGIREFYRARKVSLPSTVKSGNLFSAKTHLTGVEAFQAAQLIPVAPGVFKRAQTVGVGAMIESMYDYMLKSNGYEGILPDQAYYPAAFDADGTINMSKLQDPNNRLAILTSIKQWVEKEAAKLYTENAEFMQMSELQSYVLMFHYYNRSGDYHKFDVKPPMSEEYATFVNGVENVNFLLNEFPAQLNLRMIEEKRKNSDTWKNFYSNFEINANGIELKSEDPITMRRIEPYLEENQDLVNYFRIHKTKPELQPTTIEEPVIDELFRRNYYSNYPTALKPYVGEFTPIKGNTIAATTKAPFIRLSDGVYELVRGIGRHGIFVKIPTNGSDIKLYDARMSPPRMDAEMRHFQNISPTVNTTMEIRSLYSQNEKNDIDEKYDNCR